MASSIIHMAVANEINKVIKRDNDKILIGSIAPDISKTIGQSKMDSHFLDSMEDNIPNINRFLEKYKDKLSDDFVMGYFIHLYTDFFWFKYFVTEIYENEYITKLDGTKIKCIGNMASIYIYNDYTNLNTKLIEEYDLNLQIFYREIPKFNNIIDEIPMEKLNVIVDKASIIIANSKSRKDLIFNINNIKKFVETCVEIILTELKILNLL